MGINQSISENAILSHYQIAELAAKDAPQVTPISLDLGLTTTEVYKTASGWALPDGQTLLFEQVQTIHAEEKSCFQLINGELKKIEAFSVRTNRYYSLMPSPSAPTLLISGIPMHRIKDTTPFEDTKQKLKALGKPFGRVLDTATGLGYTAIQASKTADLVITVEFDPAVLGICRLNPWSAALFTQANIQPVIGDSADLATVFHNETFDAVIHDPPTFALAGDLYSLMTYRNLYRILKPGGCLFHYIGNPDSRYGATTGRGVVTRLRRAGFRVTPKERAFGVLAVK